MKKLYFLIVMSLMYAFSFAQSLGYVTPFDSIQYVDDVTLQGGNSDPIYFDYEDTVTIQGIITSSPLLYAKSASSRKACWIQDTSLTKWGGAMLFIYPGELSDVFGYTGSLDDLNDEVKFYENFIPGYTIKAKGLIGSYSGNTQIYLLPIESEIIDIPTTIDSTNIIDPILLTIDLFQKNDGSGGQDMQYVTGEPYESMFVRFENVTVVDVGSHPSDPSNRFLWYVQDEFGNKISIDDNSGYYRNDDNAAASWLSQYTFTPPSIGTRLEYIQGIIEETAYGYQINPILPSDIKVAAAAPYISKVYRDPVVPASSDDVEVFATITDNDGVIKSASLHYSIGYGNKSFTQVPMTDLGGSMYKGVIPKQVDETVVNYFIRAIDDSNFVAYVPDSFASGSAYIVKDGGIQFIADIQQTPLASGASIWDGDTLSNLNIRAVVTATIDQIGMLAIQDDTAPYSGIFLQASSGDGLSGLRIGDSIQITSAIVTESYSVTYLEDAGGNNFKLLSSGNAIPGAVKNLPVDSVDQQIMEYAEAYEGMLIEFDDQYVVDLNADDGYNYGEMRLGVHPDSTTGLRVDVGHSNYIEDEFNLDTLTLKQQLAYCKGILYYSFSNFKLVPRDKDDLAGYNTIYLPVADFSSNITGGEAPITVKFTEEVSNSSIPITFTWTFDGGNPSTSSEGNPEVEYSVPGTYDVKLHVENDDGTDEVSKTAYITITSLEELGDHLSNLVIFPNPTTNNVFLNGFSEKPEHLKIRLISQMGQIVYEKEASINGDYSVKLNLESFASGLYFIEISNDIGKASRVLIKQD